MKNKRGFRFIILCCLVNIAIGAIFQIIGLINNYKQAINVEWWKVFLGPFAWYFATCSGKGDNICEWLLTGIICLLLIVPEMIRDTIPRRCLAIAGIVLWFLFGWSVVLAGA